MDKNQQQESVRVAFMLADEGVDDAWLDYFGVGGNLDEWAVDAYLHGLLPLPTHDSNLLAMGLNERLDQLRLPQLASYAG